MKLGGNRAQHEAKNEKVEAIHCVSDGRSGKRFSRKGADLVGGFR